MIDVVPPSTIGVPPEAWDGDLAALAAPPGLAAAAVSAGVRGLLRLDPPSAQLLRGVVLGLLGAAELGVQATRKCSASGSGALWVPC